MTFRWLYLLAPSRPDALVVVSPRPRWSWFGSDFEESCLEHSPAEIVAFSRRYLSQARAGADYALAFLGSCSLRVVSYVRLPPLRLAMPTTASLRMPAGLAW